MIKTLRKSKGFTLVELLIVIIIIGILAGMMMLSSGAATDKAEATKIVSDLRNIKAATIMYYADKGSYASLDNVEDLGAASLGAPGSEINNYLDNKPASGYKIKKSGNVFFAGYNGTKLTDGVKDKLVLMAPNVGLYNGVSADVSDYYKKTNADGVFMVITK